MKYAEGPTSQQAIRVAPLDVGEAGVIPHPGSGLPTEIPARAGDAGCSASAGAVTRVSAVSSSLKLAGASVPAAFWAGLSADEDLLLWDMRRLGVDFPLIAAEIEMRREKQDAGRRGGLKRWARHYRARVRAERAR